MKPDNYNDEYEEYEDEYEDLNNALLEYFEGGQEIGYVSSERQLRF